MNSHCRPSDVLRRRGFSMIELLILIVMVGVVGGMSTGKFHSIIVQQRVLRAAAVVRTDVEAAFALASRNRRPIRVSWDATNLQLVVTDRAGALFFRRAGLGQDPYSLPPGSVTFSRSALEVYPNGLANDTLLITLSANGVTKKVWISRAGMVQSR